MWKETLTAEGVSDREEKTTGHSYSGTEQREGGAHSLCTMSHRLENPTPNPGGSLVFHPLPPLPPCVALLVRSSDPG